MLMHGEVQLNMRRCYENPDWNLKSLFVAQWEVGRQRKKNDEKLILILVAPFSHLHT